MPRLWVLLWCTVLTGCAGLSLPDVSSVVTAAGGLTVSTYLGGGAEDTIRDVAVAAQGHLYTTGGTHGQGLLGLRHFW
jgi:hypothetical protein